MPFDEDFDDVYQLGIKAACDEAGAYCERVDEQIFQETILQRIYNQIAKADIIVADMTGRNANVFYEVGYAHAIGKTTILLTKKAEDIPFDLKHFPHIVYGTKITSLRNDLIHRVRWCVENPPESQEESRIDIDLFAFGRSLASEDVVITYVASLPHVEITVFNGSGRTYEASEFSIGVVAGQEFKGCRSAKMKVPGVNLPTGERLFMLPDLPTVFPQAYTSIKFLLSRDPALPDETDTIVLRVFTRVGARDYSLTLEHTSASRAIGLD